jgi:hypothetical protein
MTRDEACGAEGSAARTATVLAVVSYSAAALAAGTSAYFFLERPTAFRSQPLRALSRCVIAPAAAVCSFSF